MRRTRRHWSMTVQKMRDTHCERRKHQTYCNRSENLHVCPACGCRLSSLADRSYYFVHDFLLMLDRFLYAPLGLGEIVSLIGRSSGSGIKFLLLCSQPLQSRKRFPGFWAGVMEGCGSAAFVRTLLKATAKSVLTGLSFLPEVSLG